MQLAQNKLSKVPGLKFFKLMGSGGEGGFGIWPNWHVYALLGIWESAEDWKKYNNEHPFALETQRRCTEQATTFLHPIRSHGLWDGTNPFEPITEAPESTDALVAVLTRARIRLKRLPEFLKETPIAKKSLKDQKDLLLSIGIGETPLLYQATFSVWRNIEAVKEYAYKTHAHAQVVSKTRERDWYSEEMFTRFRVTGSTGTWGGKTLF